MRTSTSVLTGIAAVGIIASTAACGGGSSDGGSDSSHTATSGGTGSVTVDGQALQLDSSKVVCIERDGTVTIAVGQEVGAADIAGVAATLTSGDHPEVETVGVGNAHGRQLVWTKAMTGSTPKVTKDDKTYTISGTAKSFDPKNPGASKSSEFTIQATCP